MRPHRLLVTIMVSVAFVVSPGASWAQWWVIPERSDNAVDLLRQQQQEDRLRRLEFEQRQQQQRELWEQRDRTSGWETHYPRYGLPDSRPLPRR